jgi:hypothetical protein
MAGGDADSLKRCPLGGTPKCGFYPGGCPYPSAFDAFQRCRAFRSHVLSSPHRYVPFLALYLSEVTGRRIDVSYGSVTRYMSSLVFTARASDGREHSFGETARRRTIDKYALALSYLLEALLPPEF